jgi:hypothetical protein
MSPELCGLTKFTVNVWFVLYTPSPLSGDTITGEGGWLSTLTSTDADPDDGLDALFVAVAVTW